MIQTRPPLGRPLFGPFAGLTRCLDERSSLLVVGPTQSGKTSSLVIPSIVRWNGPVLVTSVKRDVYRATARWRSGFGGVQVIDPGSDDGLTWDPLEGVIGLRSATRVARDMTLSSGDRSEGEFWNAMATRLVATVIALGVERGEDVFAVQSALESREVETWASESSTRAARSLRSLLAHDERTVDGVVTTAEAMLAPWSFPQPRASVARLFSDAPTMYLCASRAQHRHYEGLFRGVVRSVLEHQQAMSDAGTARPLLVVLDEAANVASLDELDQLAATVSGLDVTLVTVIQDFAQLRARWGERAATIVNNHSTRLVLGGLADPTIGTYLPEVVASRRPSAPSARDAPTPRNIRLSRPRRGVVVAGRRPAYDVRLTPWWRSRTLRRRVDAD